MEMKVVITKNGAEMLRVRCLGELDDCSSEATGPGAAIFREWLGKVDAMSPVGSPISDPRWFRVVVATAQACFPPDDGCALDFGIVSR
ncbi:MAG: hypothetical protein MUF10_11235 [Thermoanaerobaculaceae bacterium]|jgi:hypothetical protein|nr:hypothetical protein [Thermoanaerobaculaceae bacterium]